VIGAGPAGMAAAYRMTQEGVAVDVYEAGPAVGGMARTIDLWNQRVDLGPHRFFSNDRRVNALWLEVVGRDYAMVDRLTRIYYRGRYFHYPIKPGDALANLGIGEAARCLVSYLRQRMTPAPVATSDGDADSFEDWVVGRFGRRLFEIFFKTYSEKLWGIPCTKLDADFAAQRIKKLSLGEAIKNALAGGRGNRHKTLVDRFAYPLGGTGMVYERMAEQVAAAGGRILLRTPVRRVICAEDDPRRVIGIETEDGITTPYDHVVSTMPLTQLVRRLPNVPETVRESAGALRFRNTILVYLKVGSASLFADQWLYVHSPDLQMGRITNFRNWVPQICGDERSSILALEYWCNDDEPLWTESEERLIALGSDELRRTGLIGDAVIEAGHIHRLPRCYPVYERGYKSRLQPVEEYLRKVDNLSAIGRYGAFKYNNQDHSLLMGLMAAENIVHGAGHDLWSINTDYDSYQEEALASVITEAGLGTQTGECTAAENLLPAERRDAPATTVAALPHTA